MTNPVELVIQPRTRDLGSFEVARVLPYARRRMVGPFIFFDRMGPSTFAPGAGIDVRPHPHIGLATVTYLFEGEIMHRDSLGYEQPIRPGDVNWMSAGRGIVHSERTREEIIDTEREMFGIQSWVALPTDKEKSEPHFRHHPGDTLPEAENNGVHMRLIAGDAYGMTSPVEVASPMFYLDVNMTAGSVLDVTEDYPERAVYVVRGEVTVAGETYGENCMLVLAEGSTVTLEATGAARVMLLGGDPVDGERIIWWNFVASSQELIDQAKEDWKAGRFDGIEGDDEFIPLPEN